MGRKLRLAFALVMACTFSAWAAPSALAAYGVTNFSATPASPNAGANTDFTVSYDFQEPEHQLKDVVIHLPPGLLGNPLATTACSEQQLNANACPAESAVGTVSNTAVLHNLPAPPLTVNGTIFNVTPRAGEPARFGFVLNAPGSPIIVQSGASLRSGDFGLDTTLNDLPRTVMGAQIDITHIEFTLNGQAGSPPQGFLRNPTSCGSHPTGIDVTAYDGQTASAQTSFDTVNCAALPFAPKFSASIEQSGPLTGPKANPVQISTTISQTLGEAGLKRAVVTLPGDLGPNSAAFANTCEQADFQAGTCPAASIVGSARAASPLQAQPLSGSVVLLAPGPAGGLPSLGLDLRGALALKLTGKISLDSSSPGKIRNQVTFDGLPDIPISDFTLTFAGGEGGLNLAARNPCKPPPFQFDTSFLSYAGGTVNATTDAKATCRGSGGGGKGGKKPRATLKLKTKKGSKPVLKLKVKSGAAPIRSAKLRLTRKVAFATSKRGLNGRSKIVVHGKGARIGKVKATKRTLKVKVRGSGAKRIKGRFDEGAVRVRGNGRTRQRFRVVVRDTDGAKTKLSVRAK